MSELLTFGTVSKISFDFGIELIIDSEAILRIEGSGFVFSPDGTKIAFESEQSADVAGLIVSLFNTEVELTMIDSAIHVSSEAMELLIVEPSKDFEAWSFSENNGTRIVCGANGELTRWRP